MRLLSLLALLLLAGSALAEGLAGIDLFAGRKQLEAVKYQKLEEARRGDIYMVAFKLPNGNVVSVKLDESRDKVVFIEYDWGGNAATGGNTGIGTLRFGNTSVSGLQQAHGSKGFTFRNFGMMEDEDDLISFNGYPLARVTGGVVVFISKLSVPQLKTKLGGRMPTPAELADAFRLDAIVLAESAYLDELWGEDRVSDSSVPALGW